MDHIAHPSNLCSVIIHVPPPRANQDGEGLYRNHSDCQSICLHIRVRGITSLFFDAGIQYLAHKYERMCNIHS